MTKGAKGSGMVRIIFLFTYFIFFNIKPLILIVSFKFCIPVGGYGELDPISKWVHMFIWIYIFFSDNS